MKKLLAVLTLWVAMVASAHAAPWPTGCLQGITVGSTVNGQLTTADCFYSGTGTNRFYLDIYAFAATAGTQVAIAMNSGAFDTYLELYNVNDSSVDPIAVNDNSGTGTNSRIPQSSGFFTLPTTGTYYIVAVSNFNDQTGAYSLSLTANAPSEPAQVTVYEFRHPVFNHYFITAYPEEAAHLTAGGLPPWVPTGQTFKAWAAAGTNIIAVCRFFSNTFAPKSSHFYSHTAIECPALAQGGVWQLEAPSAFYMMPSAGTCSSGTMPLYRLYNDGRSGAPNHRYTNNAQVRTQMIGAGWIPEGNGPDGVFACIPQSPLIPPTNTGSAFQQEVTGYANRILGLVNGNLLDVDQLTLLLSSTLQALTTPGSTCPAATSNPPLDSITTVPSSLTISASYGTGCSVPGASPPVNMAGSATVSLTQLVLTETTLAANFAVSLVDLKVNGNALANGAFNGTMNLAISSAGDLTGPVTISIPGLQLANGIGMSGSIGMTVNSAGTSNVTTNLTFSPDNVTAVLNLNVAVQADGSMVVNSTGTNTVGAYAVQVTNIRIDPAVCTAGAVAGSIGFTKQGQTGTLTFNNSCSYTYSGP